MIFRSFPVYFWFFVVWCISKTAQLLFNHEKTIWELIWEKSVIICNNSELMLFVIGIFVTSIIVNGILVSMFTVFDFTQKPDFIRKYKVNPQTNEPPNLELLKKGRDIARLNGFIVVIPSLIATFYGLKWRGLPNIHNLPNIQTVLISCFLIDHIIDAINYTFHRILHHRLLYKHFHKMHHEYISTIATAVFHAHPVDQFLTFMIPLAVALMIMRCHIATTWISLSINLITSVIIHSGYHLPFLNSPEFHDFHHMKFDSNYSILGLMDWIFGTDKKYRNTIYEKRDRVLLSFKSAHELYPMENN